MDCLRCGGEMEVRELHPLFESGGITFRCEAAVLHFACDNCRLVSAAPIDAPAPPAPAPTPAALADVGIPVQIEPASTAPPAAGG